jgi:hypothetical protein
LESGGGANYGPWFTLTSTAPPDFTFKRAEGHIVAWPDRNKQHACGVTSDMSPISQDGPTKGYRSGTAHWAQCYIAEQDDTHVVMKVNLQGVEGVDDGIPILSRPNKASGEADLAVVYAPLPTK